MPFQDHPLPADFSVVPIIQRSKPLPPRKKKGAVARITRDLKQGIIEAAENIGSDGNGEGGLVGFLEDLGRHHKKAFAGLLGKVLPMQPSASTGVSPVAINIIGVPSGHYLSEEDIAKARGETLQIEHYE